MSASSARAVCLAIVARVLLVAAMFGSSAAAAPPGAANLAQFLPGLAASDVVPGADRFGPVQPDPAVAPAYRGAMRT